MVENILEYIKSNFERGLSIEVIKQNLLGQGHSDYDIDEAIKEFKEKIVELENESGV